MCARGAQAMLLGGPSTSPLGGNAEASVAILDRMFGWLLVVGALLHAVGSWHAFHSDPPQLLWALPAPSLPSS